MRAKLIAIFLACQLAMAQIIVTNDGAPMKITANAVFYIQGGMWVKNNAQVINDGDLYLSTNTDPGTEDWINDASPTALQGTGTVYLYSDEQQNITGSFSTTFYNLKLGGTGTVRKKLLGVDAFVLNQLDLSDDVLDLDTNILYLLNPDPASLTRTGPVTPPYQDNTSGGVIVASSTYTNKGFLARLVNSGNTYLFPFADQALTMFRPVEIRLDSSRQNSDTLFVRVVFEDPSVQGYDIARKSPNVGTVFNNWYALIHDGTYSASRLELIRLFFDPALITPQAIVHWRLDAPSTADNNPPAWSTLSFVKDSAIVNCTGNNALCSIENLLVYRHDLTEPAFALATLQLVESPQDTVLSETELYIPNMFSPNGDGVNDEWRVYGPVDQIHIIIYDRWGKRVFETRDPATPWDGTYNGKPLNSGIYAYYVKGTLSNGKSFEEQGYILLVR